MQLGLESRSGANKPCFAWQLKRCKGVCCGRENPSFHRARLEAALASLQVRTWPYDGAVGLIETLGERTDVHVVSNWCYLGTANSEEQVWSLLADAPSRPAFDLDTYKILSKALLNPAAVGSRITRLGSTGGLQVRALDAAKRKEK